MYSELTELYNVSINELQLARTVETYPGASAHSRMGSADFTTKPTIEMLEWIQMEV